MIRKGMAKTSFPPPPCPRVALTFVSGPSTFGLFAAIGTYGQAILPLANPHAAYTLPPPKHRSPRKHRGVLLPHSVWWTFISPYCQSTEGGAEGCHVSHRNAVPSGNGPHARHPHARPHTANPRSFSSPIPARVP